jgi:signal recognition particle subunit SRP54
MFDDLSARLEGVLRKLRGRGVLTEENVRETLREVRRILLEADVHHKVARDFVARVETRALGQEVLKSLTPGQQVIKVVHAELTGLLGGQGRELRTAGMPPTVILVAGLQGSGKTTFAGKLARHLGKRGRGSLLAACDVHRPAAIDQLERVGAQAGVPVYADRSSRDPVAIAAGALASARQRAVDYLVLDTAGRLHVDAALMDEAARIRDATHPHETLLVLDGLTGQDAVRVAESFQKDLGIDGVVLTKMDGDARGGAALSIRAVSGAPILFLGTGEGVDALERFHPERMASRILGMGDVLSLIEKAEESIDAESAQRLEEKLRRREFTLEDFLSQLREMRKMGPLSEILGMIPGMGSRAAGLSVDESATRRVEAIILSMTPAERRRPSLIDGSRRRRIAGGSGTTVQDVNRLLRQFEEMRKMVRLAGRDRRRLPFPGS